MTDTLKISFRRMVLYELRFSFKNCPVIMILEILASIVHGISFVAVTYMTQVFFDVTTEAVNQSGTFRWVLFWALMLGGIVVFNQVINGVENYLYDLLYNKLNGFSYLALYKKISKMDAELFESPDFLNELNKAKEGAQHFTLPLFPIVGLSTFYLAYFLGMGWYIMSLKPILVIALILVFIPSFLSQFLKVFLFSKLEDESAPYRRKFTHYEDCICGKEYFKETRMLNAIPFFEKLYNQTLDLFTKKAWMANKKSAQIEIFARVITLCGYMGVILLLIYGLLGGDISVGAFAAVFASIGRMFSMMDEVVDTVGELSQNIGLMKNYIAFMDIPDIKKENVKVTLERDVILKNVTYRYKEAKRDALSDINLQIKAGETVAVVGENGSGKTTLVRVMTGIFSPIDGQVLYDNFDISKTRRSNVYNLVSVVFQNFVKYKMTARDNVCISKDLQQSARKDVELEELLRRVGIFLKSFPQGLDTMLSREFGDGDLSGGEWQRMAIARGMYRSHQLIVLDEPTAAIDPIEESRLFHMFEEMSKGKTAIIVTHRLGCVKLADRIIVMDNGRICEEGTHVELLKNNGKYKEMYDSQAQWYQR